MRRSTLLSLGVVLALSLTASAETSFPSRFKARDIDGVRLDMTVPEVAALFNGKLNQLSGTGAYTAERDNISFHLSFSPRGRLFLVESTQRLGRFQPDKAFMSSLEDRLIRKYGVNRGGFYAGVADWTVGEKYGEDMMFWRPNESLTVGVHPNFGDQTVLIMKFIDFRIERRDIKLLNDGPAAKASKAVRF